MNQEHQFNLGNKKKYEKPGLRIIELETDQVLITGCKMDSGAAGVNNVTNSCVTPTLCADVGS